LFESAQTRRRSGVREEACKEAAGTKTASRFKPEEVCSQNGRRALAIAPEREDSLSNAFLLLIAGAF
jgi:hypothetical protein